MSLHSQSNLEMLSLSQGQRFGTPNVATAEFSDMSVSFLKL